MASNFPLGYRVSWLPRLLRPSLRGDSTGFAPAAATFADEPAGPTVRLAFLGDISAVASAAAPACDDALRGLIASADLVIGNCESPVVLKPRAAARTRLGLRHAMDASFLLGVIQAIGVEADRLFLSLANNHVLDQGIAGFNETVETLDHLGIGTIGLAGSDPLDRVRLGPLTIGLLAFTQWRNAPARAFDGRVTMAADIEGWQPQDGETDLICAVPHWGWEFRHFPSARTRALARLLVMRGVGLVAGHHAHVVQPVERIGDAVVAYGLGDFLGTAWSRQPWPGRIGAVLVVDVGADERTRGAIVGYRLVPFLRLRDGGREVLVPPHKAPEPLRTQVSQRLEALYGGWETSEAG